MVRNASLVVIFINALVCLAQAQSEVETDSVEVIKWHQKYDWTNLGIHAQVSQQYAPTPGGWQEGAWLSAGVFVKKWHAGVFISTYEDTYQTILIFPNQFDMNYLYGGYYLGYTLLQNRWLQANVSVAAGRGDVIWERSTTFENYYRDTFTMFHYMIELEEPSLRFFRPIVQIGYRTMRPIALPEISNDQFSGFSLIFGIRVGFYTKQPEK